MGNLFSEIAHRVGDLVSYPVKSTKDLITNPKKGIKDWEHLYTHNEHEDQRLFQQGFGIHGWVGKHPQETAAAVVATIFGGWAAWGAYGAGAAGGATAGAAGGTAGGSGIAAGTTIGQTVPAIPSAASMMSGTGAAVTSAPSYSIVAGSSGAGTSLSSGGYMATHLGGEAEISNTGLTSGGSSWMDWAKRGNQINNMMNQDQPQDQDQSSSLKPAKNDLLNSFMGSRTDRTDFQTKQQSPQPQTTTQLLGNTAIGGNSFSNNFGSFR